MLYMYGNDGVLEHVIVWHVLQGSGCNAGMWTKVHLKLSRECIDAIKRSLDTSAEKQRASMLQ